VRVVIYPRLTCCCLGGGIHGGLPPVTVMHAVHVPVNYNMPLAAAVPLPASVTQMSYVTTAQTVTSPPTPADVVC